MRLVRSISECKTDSKRWKRGTLDWGSERPLGRLWRSAGGIRAPRKKVMREDCKDLGVSQGDWQRATTIRCRKVPDDDWALSFSAESQVVVMANKWEAFPMAEWVRAAGSMTPSGMASSQTNSRKILSTPRECLEQGKHGWSCVSCPQEPGVHNSCEDMDQAALAWGRLQKKKLNGRRTRAAGNLLACKQRLTSWRRSVRQLSKCWFLDGIDGLWEAVQEGIAEEEEEVTEWILDPTAVDVACHLQLSRFVLSGTSMLNSVSVRNSVEVFWTKQVATFVCKW